MFREGGTCPANENKLPCVSAEELDNGRLCFQNTQMPKLLLCNIPHSLNQDFMMIQYITIT